MTNKLRSKCKKHDVRSLAWTRWDERTGKWKIVGGHDTAYCRNCDTHLSVKTWKPVKKKCTFPPDLAGDNGRRAERARAAVAAYLLGENTDPEDLSTDVGDLFADLLHYWDRYGTDADINDMLGQAARDYEAETSNNLADVLGAAEVVDRMGRVISRASQLEKADVKGRSRGNSWPRDRS